MKLVQNEPLLDVPASILRDNGISEEEFGVYFPGYIREPFKCECGEIKYAAMKLALSSLAVAVKVLLKPRNEDTSDLDTDKVNRVYTREAANYDWKHHLTTRGMDTSWRRLAGYCALTHWRNNSREPISILDLCTGTGQAVAEMSNVLALWKMKAKVVGLDYNESMLSVAVSRKRQCAGIDVEFVRGDAMSLVAGPDSVSAEFAQFAPGSFDMATQMCGIGGISDSVKVFSCVLQVLKPGGHYFLADMHRPIPELAGEWPFPIAKWWRFPLFEVLAYESTTKPLVLNCLWGWRDPTLDFYLPPLVTWRDKDGQSWGFRVVSFETESQRWWLGLPVMPVAKLIVEKVQISQDEFDQRRKILSLVRQGLHSHPNTCDNS